jgi:hypothetical protein
LLALSALYFPAPNGTSNYCNKPDEFDRVNADASLLSEELKVKLAATGRVPKSGDVKYVFVTKSGPGPISQPESERLLDTTTGLPVEPGPSHKRMKIGE